MKEYVLKLPFTLITCWLCKSDHLVSCRYSVSQNSIVLHSVYTVHCLLFKGVMNCISLKQKCYLRYMEKKYPNLEVISYFLSCFLLFLTLFFKHAVLMGVLHSGLGSKRPLL